MFYIGRRIKQLRLHIIFTLLLVLVVVASAQAACVNLGTAASFGLLGGSAVTNAVPGTVILGDVGVSPGTSVTGFPPGVFGGTLHINDAVAAQAQSDLTTAYNSAAGAPCTQDLTGTDLGTFNAGNPLLPGVYCFTSSAFLTGNLTLDAQGDPNACWIFQIGSTLITATNATVTLINGANPCCVFWQVSSSATIETGNVFAGTIMALTSITLKGGVLNGRALARNGAVTISGSEFVNTVCAPAIPCVSITKKANRATAAVGDTITYTYTVCNCGTTTINVNSVIDTKEGNLTANFVTANGGSSTLAAGACAVFTKNHLVVVADVPTLTNSVTVTAQDSGGTPATSTDQTTVTITPTPPTDCVSITKVGNRILAAVGDSVTYTYTVCNCGTSTLTVDSVVDSPVGDLTADFITANGSSTTLAAGTCVSFPKSRTVLATDPNPLTNSVTVTAHAEARSPVTSTDTWTVTIIEGTCVSVGKVADRATAAVGESINYTFTVCNCGTTPLTMTSVLDSLQGELIAGFLAANGGSPIVASGDCVIFSSSYMVQSTDPSPLVNTVTVTANSGETVVTDTNQATVLIVVRQLVQAIPANSLGTNLCFRGYLPGTTDVITAAPGIFHLIPQGLGDTPWANFITAAQAGVPYVIKNIALVKSTPEFTQCFPVFPAHTVRQQGTPNIRLWWPLMYETPGTTFTLSILYGTPSLFDDDGPGPHKPAWAHVETTTWTVVATLDSLGDLLAVFHELPFGLDEVPLISDENLYEALQLKIAAANAAFLAGDTATAAFILADFELEVMDACIDESPAFPNPTGPGTGIASTDENPACCKLLVDIEYILKTTGIGQPKMKIGK